MAKTALFTSDPVNMDTDNTDGRVTFMHHQPEKFLTEQQINNAALVVDYKVERPKEGPDGETKETHRPVAHVKDGEITWEWVERKKKRDQ